MSNIERIVVDTNVFVGACLGAGASKEVVAVCLRAEAIPLIGAALLAEYEDVLGRPALFARSRLDPAERDEFARHLSRPVPLDPGLLQMASECPGRRR